MRQIVSAAAGEGASLKVRNAKARELFFNEPEEVQRDYTRKVEEDHLQATNRHSAALQGLEPGTEEEQELYVFPRVCTSIG